MLRLEFEGSTLNGMAASENISPRRANELFDILGIPRPRLARHRALLAHVRDVDLKVLDELAAEAGISRSEVATRILLAVLSSGKRSAARILGKLAR